MISKIPSLTDSGKALLMRALVGEALTFTRLAIGSGVLAAGQDQNELTELINEELSITPASIDDTQEGLIAISGDFSSADITEDFVWRELGVFAMGEDEEEVLYAYANDGTDAGTLRKLTTNILTEQTLTLVVEIGDAENVGAIFNPHTQYAPASTLTGHMNNTSNPHNVTAAQVGLGNVVNKSPENMTVAFTAAGTRENISTGEKLSVMFGKLAKIITDVISHLTSTSNPHSVTASQVGLGNVSNTSPENTTVAFTEAETRANIATGEKLSVMFGKISKVLSDVITHLTTTSGNPHSVTKSDVGLGNVDNTAPSFNVVNFEPRNSYAVPATGETMATMMSKVAKDLTDLQTHMNTTSSPNPHEIDIGKLAEVGVYTGDGTQGREIALAADPAFTPSAVMVWDEFGRQYNATKGVCGGLATSSRGIRVPNSTTADDATTWSNTYTALMIVTGGFKVNYLSAATAEDSIDTNENGVVYRYIAWK